MRSRMSSHPDGASYRSWPRTATSTGPPRWYVNAATRTYMALSGTSMAAAVTTGVVADIIWESRSANGGRTPTPNVVKAILQFTAVPVLNADTLSQGAGSINPAGAIALARAIDTTVPVSSLWLTEDVPTTTTLSSGEVLTWGSASSGTTKSSGVPTSTTTSVRGVFRSSGETGRSGATRSFGERPTTALSGVAAPRGATRSFGERTCSATTTAVSSSTATRSIGDWSPRRVSCGAR